MSNEKALTPGCDCSPTASLCQICGKCRKCHPHETGGCAVDTPATDEPRDLYEIIDIHLAWPGYNRVKTRIYPNCGNHYLSFNYPVKLCDGLEPGVIIELDIDIAPRGLRIVTS